MLVKSWLTFLSIAAQTCSAAHILPRQSSTLATARVRTTNAPLNPSAGTSRSTTTSSTTSTSRTTIPNSDPTTSITTTTTVRTTTTVASSTTVSTTSQTPVVTDLAYINTILRHHNRHRANHSANALTWSVSSANTARKIAESCVYAHDTATDGGGYGQNIGAGFPPTAMGQFVSDGLYNSEVNAYTAYGAEPNLNDLGAWGHFTQIVWKATAQVGCYTQDCSGRAGGLQGTGSGIPPYFTVCNYVPAGNVVGGFAANIGRPLGFPTIVASYGCPSAANCA